MIKLGFAYFSELENFVNPEEAIRFEEFEIWLLDF